MKKKLLVITVMIVSPTILTAQPLPPAPAPLPVPLSDGLWGLLLVGVLYGVRTFAKYSKKK